LVAETGETGMEDTDMEYVCEFCGIVDWTGHSDNPEWQGYDLCEDCIKEANNHPPILPLEEDR
tara:strand:+ start:437 stop:625 length:189 start_codon:yes stop_codon:yes gene_type:complete